MKRMVLGTVSTWIAVQVLAVAAGWAAEEWIGVDDTAKPPASASDKSTPDVAAVRNVAAAFRVVVDVDHKDRVYRTGQELVVQVQSERSGFLYIFYQQADGKAFCLFPNCYQANNRIAAQVPAVVPHPQNDAFALPICPPFGRETLLAVVSEQPIAPAVFGAEAFVKTNMTEVNPQHVIQAMNGGLPLEASSWAEHHVEIQVVAPNTPGNSGVRRVGMFVGIDHYKDASINPLDACANDAQRMLTAFREHGSLTTAVLLTDDDATRTKIQKAFQKLVALTRPRDEIVLFWSGHGTQYKDDAHEEKDGLDEFLIPYDSSASDPRRTMLSDDEFGRWLQDLDARRVLVILDTCHSGGASVTTKDIQADFGFDFIGNELVRTKDIGAHDAILLCSSNSEQVSQVMPGQTRLSVFTYYFLERFQAQPDRGVTLQQVYEHVKTEVPRYVDALVPQRTTPQIPILVNESGRDFILRK